MNLETNRLLLRPLTLADAQTAFNGWTGDAEVAQYVSWLPHHSIDETIEWLKEIDWERPKAVGQAGVAEPSKAEKPAEPEEASEIEKPPAQPPRDNYIWGFVLKETGELFGSGGLIWEESSSLYQIGYNIQKSRWNKGYTSEAMRAVLHVAKTVLGLKRLAARHAKGNLASQTVIEKLGFVYSGDAITPHANGARIFECREYRLDLESYKLSDNFQ